MYARRRIILVFNLKEDGTLERLPLSRYGPGEFCEVWWDPEKEVPEWDGRLVRMSLEEDVAFTGGRLHWLTGRRKKLHLSVEGLRKDIRVKWARNEHVRRESNKED